DRHTGAAAGSGEPAAEVHVLVDLQAVGGQGRAGTVAEACSAAVELADVGAAQADRADLARAGGGEPTGEEHPLADLQAVGDQGGAGVAVQARPVSAEVAADAGARQADRAVLAGAGGGEPAVEIHVLANLEAVGVKGGAGVVVQARPV